MKFEAKAFDLRLYMGSGVANPILSSFLLDDSYPAARNWSLHLLKLNLLFADKSITAPRSGGLARFLAGRMRASMDELARDFLIESQEGLDRMERCLTELEERPRDAGLVGEIFRAVHTIKGTTGFLGFKRLEILAHAGENLLALLREGRVKADRRMIDGLLELLDGLRSILKTIESEANEGSGGDAALIGKLEALQLPAIFVSSFTAFRKTCSIPRATIFLKRGFPR
jgi:HPt (histidine-containing phosphotransfer) domain-containing protein